ncbi:13004_t:CDS:10, partial [Entrophospora sp. SA101]
LDINGLPQTEEEIDFTDIEEKYKVSFEKGLDTIIVVDNAPVVDQSRVAKLLTFIKKIFKNVGEIKENGIFMPMDPEPEPETGKLKSRGLAIKQYDGYPMDKTHYLALNHFTDIEKYSQIEEEYKEPEEEKFVEKEHLRSWLTDPSARDQFVLYHNDDVHIFWNKKKEPPEEVYKRTNWTETYVQWSPLGTYLATFHRQGIALWGGSSWNKITRFYHPNVKLIDFSPNETYLVTWSNEPISLGPNGGPGIPFGPDDEGNQIIIWDVRFGVSLRSFPSTTTSPTGELSSQKIIWPIFKWSPSDKYFARVTQDQQISVYETPEMGLLDKKSIKIEGVMFFEWAPTSEKSKQLGGKKSEEFLLSYWTREIDNQPARVTLLKIPSKEVLRIRTLVNVKDVSVSFQIIQNKNKYKHIDRHTKTKKSTYATLEIFRIREKDIPVEVIEIKDTVITFAWEPNGERFAIITTNDPNYGQPGVASRTNVSLYYLEKPKPGKSSVANFKLIIDRHTKTKKSTYATLEIFRIREKDIPVEVIEIKDTVITFAWEPNGERFAIITTNDPNYGQPGVASRTNVSLYYLEKPKPGKSSVANFKLIKTLEKKTSNSIFWSPHGRHFVLATLRSQSVFDLEFWDLDFEGFSGERGESSTKNDPAASIQLMSTQEHYGVTDIEWDPTGRFVISSSSMWRQGNDNGYTIWDFKGTSLQKHLIDKFKQLLWRPRPKSLLSNEQKQKIKKNLREYSKQFDEEDTLVQTFVSKEQIAHRRRLMDEWNAWRKRVEKELSEEREKAGFKPTSKHVEENVEIVEEWIEEVVEELEEVIDD